MIHPSTLQFLKNLKKHNNKPWFYSHRPAYVSAKTDFESFVQQLIRSLAAFDQDIKELQPKNCTFRINRDIRFSKNKTPYKTNMGAYFSKGGKKSLFAGYYFNLEPGGTSFAGGGLWMPEAAELKKLRQEIDYCFPEFKKILASPYFTKQFGALEADEKQMLVNVPKGYDKENPAAQFLKLKSFTASKSIPDALLTSPLLVKEVSTAFKALSPLISFFNRALS